MATKIGRREFLGRSVQLGASALLGETVLGRLAQAPVAASAAAKVDVAVVQGADYGGLAVRAVDLVGGMGTFVAKGARVLLMPNVQSKNPGTFTKPEIFRAVIRMCKNAGAKEIGCLSYLTPQHWDGAGLAAVVADEGIGLKFVPREDVHFRAVPVPGATVLKDAKLMNDYFAYDVFINLPVTKDHAGNRFTGSMKNLMALHSPTENRAVFHKPNWKIDPADIAHLDTCIVDLNLALKPTLNIVDATEVITTNGPMGPGDLLKPMKVVAGTDRVAVDAACATLLGLKPEEIGTIRLAYQKKLGEIDLKKVAVRDIKL
jgi:uncharacterized protein (DUF362 family)